MRTVYIIQHPVRYGVLRRVRWELHRDTMMAFESREQAEQFAGPTGRTIVRERGGSTEVVERHTARDKHGRPIWRVLGIALWQEVQ